MNKAYEAKVKMEEKIKSHTKIDSEICVRDANEREVLISICGSRDVVLEDIKKIGSKFTIILENTNFDEEFSELFAYMKIELQPWIDK